MFVHILEWGKTDACFADREQVNTSIEEPTTKYDEYCNHSRLSDVVKYKGHHMSPEDHDTLSRASETAHPLLAPED